MIRSNNYRLDSMCKMSGLAGTGELSYISETSVQTLHNWRKNKKKLLLCVIAGASQIKKDTTK